MIGKDINWTEGLFVQPHHFQQAFLNLEQATGSVVADYMPHYTGVSVLKFSDSACEAGRFEVTELDCRFPGGLRLTYPGNAIVESRSLAEQLDANKGRLEIFLGLPTLSDQAPNCLRFDEAPMGGNRYRYVSRMVKVHDAVSGGNEREVEVKYLTPKLLFSGENTFGYDTIRLAVVERSGEYGSVPKADPKHVPPCIAVAASPFLLEVRREIGNRLVARNRALREYWRSKETASTMKARDAFKVQALAMAANSFMQLTSTNRIHPFVLYTRITEIIGMLSIYSEDDRDIETPVYDHDNLSACFQTVHHNLVKLLSLLEESSFMSRVFELGEEGLRCPMDESWLGDAFDHYICFESSLPETEVAQKVLALKAAPENLIPVLEKRRIRGMNLEGPLHHLPQLPTSGNHHYFKIPRDHTYFPKLREFPTLGVRGPHQFAELVTLYVVERK